MVAVFRKDIMRLMYDRVYHVMGLDARVGENNGASTGDFRTLKPP